MAMNNKHRKTLQALFATPIQSGINWADIEALFMILGAERYEGNGSRVRFLLNDVKATFHRPHPHKETDKGAVVSVRNFLKAGGIEP
ncbi:MAG TPA: type II toxin-antitoxin system HicA family toxin [Desulfuromonadales bacterium]|nr:type II toxin-antitoxin system HicA family toxin [Desulfuromonadales bacterium]